MLRSSINIQLARIARKILVTSATFAIFADISGPLLASLLSKSRILLHLLFLRFLRYLSWLFLARKKNPRYFCDFCDNCRVSRPFLASLLSKYGILLHLLFLRYLSWVFLARKKNRCYFCDFRNNCGHFGALLGFFAF